MPERCGGRWLRERLAACRAGSVGTEAWLLEHLSDADLELVARAVFPGASPDKVVAGFRSDPAWLEEMLGEARLFDFLFQEGRDPILRASPFLVLAVLLARVRQELARAAFVEERTRGAVVPLFDVEELREFLAEPARRLHLVEVLASFTRVASGSFWVRTPKGWRRRRFSELDPVALAALLEAVGEVEKAGVYRRLGDLALFLAGIFPDHLLSRRWSPLELERLARSGGLPGVEEGGGAVALMERLGQRWYALAAEAAGNSLLEQVSARFRPARRILNYLADRYLFGARARWFRVPGRAAG